MTSVRFDFEDGTLTVSLSPPTAIGSWAIRFKEAKRFGGLSGLIIKSTASGYGGGASGITIVNSGDGRLSVAINGVDTSGMDIGNYAFSIERTDSGSRTVLSQGFHKLMPSSDA